MNEAENPQERHVVNRILSLIRNNEWEEAEQGGALRPQGFFQQNHIGNDTLFGYKMVVMLMMSRENLKFPQLQNVNNENPQELHNLLMDIFGTTENNTLDMIHILACIVNRKSTNAIKNLNQIVPEGQSILERCGESRMTLHRLICFNKFSYDDIMNKLIDIGGKEFVTTPDNDGRTALHWAYLRNGVSDDVINKLIEVGGKELMLAIDNSGRTVLHFACVFNASVNNINKLIDIGGEELLAKDNFGRYALLYLLSKRDQNENISGKVFSLISKGIRLQVGGEFGIGGLFNFASEEEQNIIYQNWNDIIIPALETNMALISTQPILQAAIIAKAPPHIIRDILSRFDCITFQDNMGRYPIDVAVVEGLKWDDGVEYILRAHMAALTAAQQGEVPLMINVAALHGLKWENDMEQVVKESMNEVENDNVDALTGLLPFMLAAVGNSSDLSSIYEMIRNNPHDLKLFDPHHKCQGDQGIHDLISKKHSKKELLISFFVALVQGVFFDLVFKWMQKEMVDHSIDK